MNKTNFSNVVIESFSAATLIALRTSVENEIAASKALFDKLPSMRYNDDDLAFMIGSVGGKIAALEEFLVALR